MRRSDSQSYLGLFSERRTEIWAGAVSEATLPKNTERILEGVELKKLGFRA